MPPAALPAMAPRIDLLECLADVFVGGVLSTQVALVMGLSPFMAWVRAGAEAEHFPSACIYGNTLYAEVK
jgi:hypothetical protein